MCPRRKSGRTARLRKTDRHSALTGLACPYMQRHPPKGQCFFVGFNRQVLPSRGHVSSAQATAQQGQTPPLHKAPLAHTIYRQTTHKEGQSSPMTTPYTGKVAMWHWKGDGLSETTIEELVRNLKRWCPHVTSLFVKTTDGPNWMSRWDRSADMAIAGRAAIQRWVRVLEANGMEFHAWCVPTGVDVVREADLIIETCTTPGVKSMILDVEPYRGFWQAGREPIRPFMTRIRRGVGGLYHIGMSTDPRPQHYNSIFPSEWRPFVNSLHPQTYWNTFERPMQEVLDEAYRVWSSYGLPIFPVLPGNAPAEEIRQGRDYVISKHKALGLSYWRYGVINAEQFAALNQPISPVVAPPPPQGDGRIGQEIVVTPDDPRFAYGTHAANVTLTTFKSTWGWTSYFKSTRADRSQAWARWTPNLSRSGRYEVSVFVPARNASTGNARYRIHGIRGQTGELLVALPQARYLNLWVSLGVFDFDANNPQAGVMFLNDLTGESDKLIAFDAVRYRELINADDDRYLADGFDAPVGTAAERAGEATWPGRWIDATGYARHYFVGSPAEAYHTGADLNLNHPFFDADRDAPVYSAASGVVTFSARLPGWGWLIVIRHDPLITTGQVVYGRYAHVNQARVQIGDRVVRGQQIANVGNADGAFAYHLHFDLSHTRILETSPGDWPKMNLNRVLANYLDPRDFIEKNRPLKR